jgi:hypothetical protein
LAAGTYSTTAFVNVRSGPGTGYQLIGTEPGGAPDLRNSADEMPSDLRLSISPYLRKVLNLW